MGLNTTELKKRILSHKQSNETLEKDFSKLAKSTSFIDNDRVKSIYDEVFYRMPKGGKEAHEDIIKQSYDYIYHDKNLILDKEIKELSKIAYSKETEFASTSAVPAIVSGLSGVSKSVLLPEDSLCLKILAVSWSPLQYVFNAPCAEAPLKLYRSSPVFPNLPYS